MRPEKFGGPLHYVSYDDLVRDFKEKKLHPADLKPAVATALNTLLEPVQKLYETEEFKKIKALAYPDEEPKAKKVKAKKRTCLKLLTTSQPYDCAILHKGRGWFG